MAAKVVAAVAVAFLLVLHVVAATATGDGGEHSDVAPPAALPPLVARLHFALADDGGAAGGEQGGGGVGEWMMECWGAVTELRSCTNEIVLFFINGESYLGRECCVAIRTVTRHCWPAMLASIGFTAEEADVLRGFCDAEVGGAGHGAPPPPSPAMAPAPAAHTGVSRL